MNSRLDNLQAGFLNIKLKKIKGWTRRRQEIGSRYLEELSNINGLDLPRVHEEREHVWHLFVIETDSRNQLADYLMELGIQTNINYPVALPFLPAYNYLGLLDSDFPVARRAQDRILSLPLYPQLSV